MKELLLSAARYNAWANEQFIALLLEADEALFDRELVSSFTSIRKTLLHVWGAEDIWLQRFERVAKPEWKAASFNGTTAELCARWKESSAGLIAFVERQDEAALSAILTGMNLKGQPFADPLPAALLHVTIHGGYHRGQLVTLLRQLGITAIPQTDYIEYVRRS